MKFYMLWAGNVVIIGRVDEAQVSPPITASGQPDQLTNPARVHKPMLLLEQVAQGRTGKPNVQVGFGPLAASVYVPWLDVNWQFAAPLDAMAHSAKIKAAYEKMSDEIHIQATTGLQVVGRVEQDAATAAYEAAQKMKDI